MSVWYSMHFTGTTGRTYTWTNLNHYHFPNRPAGEELNMRQIFIVVPRVTPASQPGIRVNYITRYNTRPVKLGMSFYIESRYPAENVTYQFITEPLGG